MLRAQKNVTLAAVANAIGCFSSNALGNWESGTHSPPSTELQRLADYFGVSADYILGTTDQPQGLRPGWFLIRSEVEARLLDLPDDRPLEPEDLEEVHSAWQSEQWSVGMEIPADAALIDPHSLAGRLRRERLTQAIARLPEQPPWTRSRDSHTTEPSPGAKTP